MTRDLRPVLLPRGTFAPALCSERMDRPKGQRGHLWVKRLGIRIQWCHNCNLGEHC